MNLSIDEWGGVQNWADALGDITAADSAPEDMVTSAFRLIRYDDAWRPLGMAGQPPLVVSIEGGFSTVEFSGVYGGERKYAYGTGPKRTFPSAWPAAFDAWPYAGDIHPHAPMRFSGRLTAVPVRAMIELNKQRMAWMRKLNPRLLVGLNNTTGWAGVRYSDWNQLEGGNCWNREIPWIYQPAGVVDKRHTTPLFGPPSGPDLYRHHHQRPERSVGRLVHGLVRIRISSRQAAKIAKESLTRGGR